MFEWFIENSEIIKNVIGALMAVGGFLGIVVMYYRKIRPAVIKVAKTWETIDSIVDNQTQIKNELSYNGGNSIKDMIKTALERIENTHNDISIIRGVQRTLINRAKIGFFEADSKGRYVWVSTHYLEMTGKQLGDVLVNGWATCVSPEDRSEVIKEWNESIEHDRDFDMHYSIIGPRGEDILVRGLAKRVKNTNGVTIAFTGSLFTSDQEKIYENGYMLVV